MSKSKKWNGKDRMLSTREKLFIPKPAQVMAGPGGSCPSPEAPWPSPTESGYCHGLHCPSLHATSSSQNKPIFLDPSHVAKWDKGKVALSLKVLQWKRKVSGQENIKLNINKTYFQAEARCSITGPCLSSKGDTLHCNLSCMNYTQGSQ